HRVALPIRDSAGKLRGYALVGHDPHATLGQILTKLGVVLLVLAFGSWPLVKYIVSPISRLTETINRVADGDLSARTGITRRDEVGQLAAAFDTMVARLETLVTQERELIANVSHELRTPLARIRVALELAEEGNDEEARRYLRDIAADLGELETLVSDLLTSARLDLSRGADALSGSTLLDADGLAEAAAERFERRFPDASLSVRALGSEHTLRGDEVLLRRVLDNLLCNAQQHGGGEAIELSLAIEDGGDRVRFSVRDHGGGIDSEDLPRVFEPFFRGERSRSRELGGVGLGLALCKRIVEAHGGEIEAQSDVGDGTTVAFWLPLERASAAN
ncbi:MAG: HAMP domain-containing histidine kinase, partial [Myxococcales bacterium]|nr:HAMP domain-containing histidine kinase [Myxococcales bacterium]